MKKDQEQYWQLDNLPNRLTMLRVALIPVVVFLLWCAEHPTLNFFKIPDLNFPLQRYYGQFAAVIFVLASITDFFDGMLARKRGIVTAFGSFLDPIADKFLVVSSLIMLMALNKISSPVVVFLVLREMYMTSLRLFAAHQNIKIPVDNIGKWKTATQMIGIPLLMVSFPMTNLYYFYINVIGLVFIYSSALLSLMSAIRHSLNLVIKIQHIRRTKKFTAKE